MTIEPALLLGVALGYLGLLLLGGLAADRAWLPTAVTRTPWFHWLAYGILFGVWPLMGLLGLDHSYAGVLSLYSLGVAALFLAMPLLLRPLVQIAQRYQLNSLADTLAFRYRSPWVGALVTLTLSLISVPLFALQFTALETLTAFLIGSHDYRFAVSLSGAGLTILISAFFGIRSRASSRDDVSIPFVLGLDTLIRVLAIALLVVVAIDALFGNLREYIDWSQLAAWRFDRGRTPPGLLASLVLGLSFALSPIVLPPVFHLLIRHPLHSDRGRWMQWAPPLLALVITLLLVQVTRLPVALGYPSTPDLFLAALGAGVQAPVLTLVLFCSLVSAMVMTLATGAMALASMWVNHGLLPFSPPRRESSDIYSWLIWSRRLLIVGIILTGWVFHELTRHRLGLVSLGVLTSVAALQLLPGLAGLLYWQRGSRTGLMAGLSVGMLVWMALLGVPILMTPGAALFNLPVDPGQLSETWFLASLFALAANALIFVLVSLRFPPSTEERRAAVACQQNAPLAPGRRALRAHNAREFVSLLAEPLGQVTAEREVERALHELGYTRAEYRPFALRHLRDRLEINLSGLLGPSVANALVERYLAIEKTVMEPAAEDLYLVENRLEGLHDQLTGMARELDQLRRFHRDTLVRLPIGVFSLAHDGEILLWNQVMEELTGVPAQAAMGARLSVLPRAWQSLFNRFLQDTTTDTALLPLDTEASGQWLNLHRSPAPDSSGLGEPAALVVLVEDQTQTKLLEEELIHSERLAAIGRLSAGVAHEIGNPVTGIDSLAQELSALRDEPEIRDVAEQIRDQARRISAIVQSLVSYAHAGKQQGESGHQACRLVDIINEAISLLQLSKGARPAVFLNTVPQDYQVLCEPQRLGQVFINLLTNARDASPRGGEILVTAEADDERILVQVIDQGHGIPDQVRDKILEPFFTTKDVGSGTGLGLSLASNIVQEHFGRLDIESPADPESGTGTCITVTLPGYQPDRLD